MPSEASLNELVSSLKRKRLLTEEIDTKISEMATRIANLETRNGTLQAQIDLLKEAGGRG